MTNNENIELKKPKVKVSFWGNYSIDPMEILKYKMGSGQLQNYKFKTDDYIALETQTSPLHEENAKLRKLVLLKDEALRNAEWALPNSITLQIVEQALELTIDNVEECSW